MSLISFLNDLFKEDGFELVDSNSKKYELETLRGYLFSRR